MASSISKKRLRSGQVLRLAARGERVGEFALIDGSHLTPPPPSFVGRYRYPTAPVPGYTAEAVANRRKIAALVRAMKALANTAS